MRHTNNFLNALRITRLGILEAKLRVFSAAREEKGRLGNFDYIQ